jgi:Capsule assembly protein Wzi
MRFFSILILTLLSAQAVYAENTFKPIDTIKTELFFTDEATHLIEGQDGLKLKKGLNIFTFEDGYFKSGNKFLYYKFKQTLNKDKTRAEIFKAFFKYTYGKFSFEVGKDNVNVGPGENGLLLSKNAPPYPLIKIQTEDYLNFIGKWSFLIVDGWLNEDRNDASNPKVFLFRATYKPWNFIELGGTRSTMYGGAGRPEYKIWEYPTLLMGKDENVVGSKFDNDGFAAFDISIFIPKEKLPSSIKKLKIYYQDAGTDMSAFWQTEDSTYHFPFGFQLKLHAYQTGILIETEKDVFRLELAVSNPLFYTHHWYYDEGYSYKGFSLGHPYGRDMQNIFFKHKRQINDTASFEYKLGGLLQPASNVATKMKRYYISLRTNKDYGNIMAGTYIRLDKTDNYDSDFSPTQYTIIKKNKTFFTLGYSLTYKF